MSGSGLVGFYRKQARLMWEWRATRLAVVRQAVLSFVIACVALAITAALLPGFTIHNAGELLIAGLLFATLNGLSRLFFLWLLAPLPIFLVQAASVAFQTLVLIVLTRLVPGFQIDDLGTAFVAGLLLTLANAVLSELARTADDDSYHGTLVRQLVARNRNRPTSEVPGMLVIQIDGLSLPVMHSQIRAGRMPVIGALLRSGKYVAEPWTPLLPSVTPASQAGILHGRNDNIPGFRWYEKDLERLFAADHPSDAEEIVKRISDGTGLLAHGGASIGNLVTGDADYTYLTMATIVSDTRRLHGLFVNTVNYIRLFVLMVGEIGKELYQAERQRGNGVSPRMHRGLAYALERAIANVALRTVSTALVIEQLYRPVPIAYVDYTGYDVIAHHCGPERQEATDALEGIDRSIGSLLKAIDDAPRPYRVVILSDHGQSLSSTFTQLFGVPLESIVGGLMGGTPITLGATGPGERRLNPQQGSKEPNLVVCASGNLGLIYFSDRPGRLSLESIERLYPGLVRGLAKHAGVGFVMVRSEERGLLVFSGDSVASLDEPAAPDAAATTPAAQILRDYGTNAAAALRRLAGFPNAGDLVMMGRRDPDTGEIVSFEELVGSHGGLGGWQTEAFVLHPSEWTLGEVPIGAPALYGLLGRWKAESQPTDEHAVPPLTTANPA